jgi:hypothetical protein
VAAAAPPDGTSSACRTARLRWRTRPLRIDGDARNRVGRSVQPIGWLAAVFEFDAEAGRRDHDDWPDFRVEHLTDEDASTARLLASSHEVRFLGGGDRVVDTCDGSGRTTTPSSRATSGQDKLERDHRRRAAADWKRGPGC